MRNTHDLIIAVFLMLTAALADVFPASLHLGSPYVYTSGSDTAFVPVFISNFEEQDLNQARFTVNYTSSRLTFLGASLSKDLESWRLSSQPAGNGTDSISIDGGIVSAYFQEIMTLKFLVSMSAGQGSPVTYSEIAINGLPGADVSTSGFRIVNAPAPLDSLGSGRVKGDANNDGRVDFQDVNYLFQQAAAGSPASSAADISGFRPTSVYDAALLYRHVIGIQPLLQNPAPPLKNGPGPVVSGGAELNVSSPVLLGGELYKYTIEGNNLVGLISADLELLIDPSIIQSVLDIHISGGGLVSSERTAENLYRILWASPNPVEAVSLEWITLVVQHVPGQTGQGINSVESFSLNEGTIVQETVIYGCTDPLDENYNPQATIHDQDSCKGGVVTSTGAADMPPVKRILAGPGHLLVSATGLSHPVRFEIYTLSGRKSRVHNAAAGRETVIPLASLPRGSYILRLMNRDGRLIEQMKFVW